MCVVSKQRRHPGSTGRTESLKLFRLTRGTAAREQGGWAWLWSHLQLPPTPGLYFCTWYKWHFFCKTGSFSCEQHGHCRLPRGCCTFFNMCSSRASEPVSYLHLQQETQEHVWFPTQTSRQSVINFIAFALFLFIICQLAWRHISNLTSIVVIMYTGQTSVLAEGVRLILI